MPEDQKQDVLAERLEDASRQAVVPDCTFNGNPLLKRENVAVGLTQWHLNEIEKCMKDPCYFAENYMKVVHVDRGLIPLKLYDYQKRMIKAMDEHRYSIILSCRQSGKCVTGSTKVKVSHPQVNDGQPFEASVEEVKSIARKLALSKEKNLSL